MKTAALILSLITAIALIPEGQPETPAAEPMGGRCISVKPICSPGTRAICICESAISLNCMWICAD